MHLVDLLLWMFDFPNMLEARGTLLGEGHPPAPGEVENYATGELRLANGVEARIACSWNLSGVHDAVIDASFYGMRGGAAMRNQEPR